MTFEGTTAFITGGAAGFGRAFADALSERGASVALVDVNVIGVVNCSVACRDALAARSGSIVNISSGSATLTTSWRRCCSFARTMLARSPARRSSWAAATHP